MHGFDNSNLSQEIFAIETWGAVICSLGHGLKHMLRPGFHNTTNATTTTQKQSDYKVEQSSFTLIALFYLEIGRCHGRSWLKAWFP